MNFSFKNNLFKFFTLSLLALVFVLPIATVKASTTSILSYQGRLTDSDGNLLGGSTGIPYFFKFSFWDSPTGGTEIQDRVWPSATPSSVSLIVKQGVFNVKIGDTDNGYPDALNYNFNSNQKVYLQIEVSSNNSIFETLGPRQQITSPAYADTSGTSTYATKAGVADSVSGVGQSSFGTTTPASNSTVTVKSTSSASTAMTLLASVGQLANIFNIFDSNNNSIFSINNLGGILANSLSVGDLFATTATTTNLSATNLNTDNLVASNLKLSNLDGLLIGSGGNVSSVSTSSLFSNYYNKTESNGLYDLNGIATSTLSNWLAQNPTSGTNTGDETLASIKAKLGVASSGVDGYLNGTDWNTFNNKQPAGNYLTSYTETDPLFMAASSSLPYQPIGSYLTSYTETDPIYSASSWKNTTNNSTNWNTAYGWGNHAGLYDLIGTATSTLNNWLAQNPTSGTNTGDESSSTIKTKLGVASSGVAGYLSGLDWNTFNNKLSSFTESDPVYLSSSWSTTTNNSTNWNTAYGWGNHASAGYLTSVLASSTYAKLSGSIFTGAISAANFSGTSTGSNTGDVTLANNTNGLTLSGQSLTMGLAGISTTGSLSSTDWNTFNNKQPAGSYLTSLSGALLANGTITGATTQAQAFTNGVITGKVYPTIDSTSSIGFYKADGVTNILNVDTTNSRVAIGPGGASVTGNAPLTVGYLNQYSSGINVFGTSGRAGEVIASIGQGSSGNGTFALSSFSSSKVFLTASGNSSFTGGNISFGTTNSTAVVQIKGGTTAAGTAPLKFTTGPLMTVAEAGAIEYATDTFYIRGTDKLSVANIHPQTDSTTAFGFFKADGTTNVMNVDTTNGRIGIGTASPGYLLDMYNSSSASVSVRNDSTQALLFASSGGYSGFGTQNATDFVIRTNGTEKLRIQSAGNVGIGTTAPGAQLQINSSFATTTGQLIKGYLSQTANLSTWLDSTSTTLAYVNATGGARFDGGIAYGTTPSASYPLDFLTSASFANFRLKSSNVSGYVGYQVANGTQAYSFGIDGPNQYFNVTDASTNNKTFIIYPGAPYASIFVAGSSSGINIGNVGFNTSAPTAKIHAVSTTTPQLRLGYDVSNYTSFTTNATGNIGIVATGGFVGIGTTSPSQALSVVGNARFTGVTSGAYANDLNLTADGTLTTSASDIRLKTNLTPIDSSSTSMVFDVGATSSSTLDKVLALKPYTFNWKTDPNGPRDTGLIAQDVQQIFPEITFTNKVDGYMGINYSRLPVLLVAAIQELSTQVVKISSYVKDGVATFVEVIASKITANEADVQKVNSKQICIGETCIDETMLKEILQKNAVTAPVVTTPVPTSGSSASSASLSTSSLSTPEDVLTSVSTSINSSASSSEDTSGKTTPASLPPVPKTEAPLTSPAPVSDSVTTAPDAVVPNPVVIPESVSIAPVVQAPMPAQAPTPAQTSESVPASPVDGQ